MIISVSKNTNVAAPYCTPHDKLSNSGDHTYTTHNTTHNSHPLLTKNTPPIPFQKNSKSLQAFGPKPYQSSSSCKACWETGDTTLFYLLPVSLGCSQLSCVYTVYCLVLFNITVVSPRWVTILNDLNSCQVMSCQLLNCSCILYFDLPEPHTLTLL